MKKLLAILSLFAMVGCQTTKNTSENSKVPPALVVTGTHYQYVGSGPAPLGSQAGKDFGPMQNAVAALQWDTVKTLAMKHLNAHPGNTDAFLFLSLAYAATEEMPRARFFAELVLKSQPSNAFALNILGVLKRKEAVIPEDYRRALVYFQLARQAAPLSPTPVMNAASLNLEIGNFAEARVDFKQARESCFNCVNAMVGSALAAQALGFNDEAKLAINDVLAVEPHNQTARLLLAGQYYYVDQEQDKGHALLAELLTGEDANSDVQREARSMLNRIEGTDAKTEVAH